ncbi:MAG: hypothetical protein H5T86_13850, partial [Armatimonadetes bacterium]|nr:hypothetical protein [Armatimonadota bacterium]
KDCQRVQEIVLIRGLRRIEFITDIQRYRGKEHLHVVAFPVNVAGGVPVFDDRSGCLVKRKSRGYMDFRTWQWRNYSDCGARHLYQWIDLSRSVTLRFGRTGAINVGSTSVVIRNDRPLEEISYQLQSALIGKGVPCTIFYDDCERDRRRNLPHEDSLLPRETPNEDLPWGTSFRFILDVGEANEYLRALFEELPPDLVAEMRAERRARGISSRLVMEEDIRIDMWEQPTPYPWPPLPTVIITAETIDDLRAAVSHLASQIEEKSVADLPEEVNAVGDLPWDDHGVAVLNRGTPLCSVENDDTIVLFLMHSVRWSRAHLDFRPVAEHKTHRFEYALYPHAGAWRDAGVPRAAYEYNNRLSVVQAEPSAGPLPAEFSFLDCHGPAILTALKPAGYPLAGLDPVPEGRPAEIALRFYEPLGFPAELELSWFSGIEQVHLADMLERPERELRAKDGRLRRKLPRFRIETLRMRVPAPDASLGETELGRRIEPGQPVYFAHWEHNAGAAPLGYSPIGVSLKGDILTDTHVPQGGWTVNRLTLGLVNSLSVPVSGKVTFDLPEGWRMEPPEVAYELPARGSAQYPVTLIFETSLRRGAVKARIEYGGQVYEAVREVGEPARVEWTLRPCKRYGAAVELRTDYPQDVTVDAWVIVPHELWGSLAETAQLCEVPESYERLVVPAGGRLRWNIHVPKDAPDAWLTVKLAYHG